MRKLTTPRAALCPVNLETRALRAASRWLVAAAMAGVCALALADVGAAQSPEAEAVRGLLWLEWKPSVQRRGIEGFVYNGSEYRIGLMRLRIDLRDGTSPPTETHAWVYGNIAAASRSPFWARLSQRGEVVAVTIESFRLIAREVMPDAP